MIDCIVEMVVDAPPGPGRFDIYVLGLDVGSIAGTRYGLCCDPDACFYFYGWTKCSDFEIPTPGWIGCGEGNAQTWAVALPGPHITIGIIDAYVYAGCGATMCVCEDPRVGYAEWCDGSQPSPICVTRTRALEPQAFGCVGFGMPGFNPCNLVPTEQRSWGSVKSLYK
jgi:hypothetical protein